MKKNHYQSLPKQYEAVLSGCRTENVAAVDRALMSLIGEKKQNSKNEYAKLYSLCRSYLKLNRIDEVRKMFERLAEAWLITVMAVHVDVNSPEVVRDVEIERIDDSTFRATTFDSEIAKKMKKIRGVRQDTMQKLSDGRMSWRFMINKRWLSGVLDKVKVPEYWKFLESHKSRQLTLEL